LWLRKRRRAALLRRAGRRTHLEFFHKGVLGCNTWEADVRNTSKLKDYRSIASQDPASEFIKIKITEFTIKILSENLKMASSSKDHQTSARRNHHSLIKAGVMTHHQKRLGQHQSIIKKAPDRDHAVNHRDNQRVSGKN
jgi:hypothetical protein